MSENNLKMSSSPHIRSKATTSNIMMLVAIALLPASAFGVWNFGLPAFGMLVTTTVVAVLTEYIYEKLMHKKITINDWSAAVTGLLLGLNMPPTAPWWMGAIGSVFAILIVKQLFGGLGQNFMNPALGARCFLLLSFTSQMTSFVYDGVTGATPLAQLKAGNAVNTMDMLIGKIPGTIGEVSKLCVLIGAAYLIIRKVISPKIPLIYIGTVAVFTLLFGGHGFDLYYLACELCAGGLIFGAFFMATDYVTSPITPLGQIIFAIMLGILTGLFRLFGGSAEGVSYAIIICNILVPMINVHTVPKAFGKEGAKK